MYYGKNDDNTFPKSRFFQNYEEERRKRFDHSICPPQKNERGRGRRNRGGGPNRSRFIPKQTNNVLVQKTAEDYSLEERNAILERLWRGALEKALGEVQRQPQLLEGGEEQAGCCCHCRCGQLPAPATVHAMRSTVSVTETHQVALAQQEKNARLREAFGISEYFVEGSSLDPARKAKEQLAKEEAERKKREQHRKEMQKEGGRYEMVRTPTPEREAEEAEASEGGKEEDGGDEGEKKKKRRKDSSSSEEHKKKKKKKSRKKDRP